MNNQYLSIVEQNFLKVLDDIKHVYKLIDGGKVDIAQSRLFNILLLNSHFEVLIKSKLQPPPSFESCYIDIFDEEAKIDCNG